MLYLSASEFVKLCIRDIAAANPAREQQGPAAHTRAGGSDGVLNHSHTPTHSTSWNREPTQR
jgi:hypothetical protein